MLTRDTPLGFCLSGLPFEGKGAAASVHTRAHIHAYCLHVSTATWSLSVDADSRCRKSCPESENSLTHTFLSRSDLRLNDSRDEWLEFSAQAITPLIHTDSCFAGCQLGWSTCILIPLHWQQCKYVHLSPSQSVCLLFQYPPKSSFSNCRYICTWAA